MNRKNLLRAYISLVSYAGNRRAHVFRVHLLNEQSNDGNSLE